MTSLRTPARWYVTAVIALGALCVAAAIPATELHKPSLFLLLLVLSLVASAFKVKLPLGTSGSTMSVSYVVDFASLMSLGPGPTLFISLLSAWTQCTYQVKPRAPLHRTLFSMACLAITVQATGAAHTYLGMVGEPGTLATIARPLVGAASVYFIVNTGMVALAVALSTRQRFLSVWNENFLWTAPSYFVGAGVAGLTIALASQSAAWLLPLTAAPVYLTYRSYRVYLGRLEDRERHVQQMSDLHLATIESLALAIDAKDTTCRNHIRRVQMYAESLARAIHLSDNEIQGVKTAALLHDIGKLAVPEHILSKPGPLSAEEFKKIAIHPRIGADIIRAVPFPYPVAPLIESHHERWDGAGYPQGLKGEAIPMGARILTIVDYYDAVTTDRPYRKAMRADAAIELLKREAGHAVDPWLVAKFVELLPSLVAEEAHVGGVRQLDVEATSPATARVHPERAEPVPHSVFDDIALAHREIYALYDIAQTMGTSLGIGDTMAVIASKLSKVVPFSSCGLFLHEESQNVLTCAFGAGVDGDLVRRLSIPVGDGVTGWVGLHRCALVNGRCDADFEAGGVGEPTTLNSALVAPLVFNDRFIGTLSLYHVEPDHYREDHRRLLERVCEQAAAVIQNSLLFEQTREDALRDALTGLPNSRFLTTHLQRELARAERLDTDVSVVLVDLDGFKEINDRHGHQIGDRALTTVARVLQSSIRPYDFCARYGGDEFVVVLSGVGREEIGQKIAELQSAVDRALLELEPGRTIQLAASVGAAVFPDEGRTHETLLDSADKRMYADKSLRRLKSGRPVREREVVKPLQPVSFDAPHARPFDGPQGTPFDTPQGRQPEFAFAASMAIN
jgi:diguanylate cyclase (GGDEF)-like protein/putative nucleotidyltransferase with HDIG domain